MSYETVRKRIEKMKVLADPNSAKIRQALLRIGNVLEAQMKINVKDQGLIDTGNLREKIKHRVTQTKDSAVVEVGSFGVPYAAVHEFGYRGPQNVPAHQRFMSRAFGRPMKNPREVNISAHIRQQNIPARPYIRPAFQKHSNFIIELLRDIGKL